MTWTAISKEKHKDMVVKRPADYEFLRPQIITTICTFELARCATWLPVVFAKENEKIRPVALMGLESGKNLLIDEKGRWSLTFFPSVFAAHPFKIGKGRDGKGVVVFFDDNSFITSEGDGERLFNEDGSESPTFNHYVELLSKMEKSNQQLEVSCSALEQSSILEPLMIDVGSGEGKNRLEGLFRINPEKFKAMDDKQVLKMHEKNALDLIYAHFFSMGGFERLEVFRKLGIKSSQSLGELGTKIFQDDKQDLNFDLN